MKKRIVSFLMAGMIFMISPLQGIAQVVSTEIIEDTSQGKDMTKVSSENMQEIDTTEVSSENTQKEESDFVITDGILTEYTGEKTEVMIPDGVASIEEHAFKENKVITKVVFPDSVKTIKYMAFQNCTSLKEIYFGNKLEQINGNAFYGCKTVQNITFTGLTVPTITNKQDFFGRSGVVGLERIYVEAGCYGRYVAAYGQSISDSTRIIELKSDDFVIENGVLVNYAGNAEEVRVPEGITEIGRGAFQNNKIIKKVILPDEVITIGAYAFSGCSSLESINVPKKVEVIGDKAFYGCGSLSGSLLLPDHLVSIGASAFYNCTSLTGNLNIPDSITSIGKSAFFNCKGYNGTLCLSAKLTQIEESAFNGCKFTGTLNLPESIKTIGYGAFWSNKFSGEVIIPDKTETIGNSAFASCTELERVIFGENVSRIGSYAISGCVKIKTLTFKGLTPPSLTCYEFFGSSNGPANLETIYVPGEALENYKSKWGSYVGSNVTFSSDFMTTKVGNLCTEYAFSHSVKLKWNSLLSEKIKGYHIYRDGVLVGTVKECSFSENNLKMGSYSY